MKLPVPGPRELVGVLERGAEQVEALLGLVPRLSAALDQVEAVLALRPRLVALLDRAELQITRVAELVDAVGVVTATAAQEALEVELVVAQVRSLVQRPELVAVADRLPELAERLETDLLPVLGTLGSVAPDLHELLAVSSELNEIIGKVPGFGRIKKRVEEEQDEDQDEDRESVQPSS